jgi:hypothetical protein
MVSRLGHERGEGVREFVSLLTNEPDHEKMRDES